MMSPLYVPVYSDGGSETSRLGHVRVAHALCLFQDCQGALITPLPLRTRIRCVYVG